MPLEKRWRPVVAPPSNGNTTLEDWNTHPRLQKHLQRFLDSQDPGRVLSRYSVQARNLNPDNLLRIAVHVGAWVALLPLEQAASSTSGEVDGSQPSPVQLLAQILRLRSRAKITEWLQGVLHLVALRLQDVRHDVQGQAAGPWMELRRSMPKTVWRELRTQRPAIPVCDESKEPADQVSLLKRKTPPIQIEPAVPRAAVEPEFDMLQQFGSTETEALTASDLHLEISKLGNEKAVRRFYHNGSAFSISNFEERALHVDSLEDRLVKAAASESWDQVCSLIREAAAALAAPRQTAVLDKAAKPMPDDAQERLQANLQSKLRKLICKGLAFLDLSDAGTALQLEPALSVMKLLIERFQVRGQLEEARAAKQWLRLRGILMPDVTTQAESNLESSPTKDSCKRNAALITLGKARLIGQERGSSKGGVYVPNVTIQSNPLVRNTGQDVILTCNKCGLELRSSWVFEFRSKVSTLVPTAGHHTCGGKYVHVDANISVKVDNSSNLKMCIHGGLANQCVKCGGSQICVHKKRTDRCPHCLADGHKKQTRKARISACPHRLAAGYKK
ncbi:unnamed protein product [Polarella glacialis]|uniref:Ig-like domain-containing protein n=1 Tax=Polarella glacialis TaxID=89957 RepID=A0A813FF88_POLGL|nr:unnamed protein product [Polarella glacialis]